ncbi:MAG: diguanylate cyclase [Alteromonas stellipolaris]|jgi:diguanylate cyclase (GGDEF)-like protein/PAS domain S-box-containing protein|uniref:sensor domain-containing diguanylate cyclase n=1 Tax=Alteromonas stellipolaris TaxID=233316 RepID=UPI001DE45C6F|nr:sensor domain-containing diguanylate cyclase [Alteromonas stellipolaris]MBZ2164082.1 diguanylate cyclase [Alteromonas stellipolaris]
MSIENVNLINLLEHASICVVIHSWDSQIVYVNPAAAKLFKTSLDELQRRHQSIDGWEFIDRQNRRLNPDEYPVSKVISLNVSITDEVIGLVDDTTGEVCWLSVSAYPEKSNGTGFVVVYFTEITKKIADFSFLDIVQSAQDMIIVTEAESVNGPLSPQIIYVNDAICKLTGYSREELIGETPRIFQGSLTDKEATTRIHSALTEKKPVTETLLNYTKKGTPYWVEMSIFPLKNQFGEVTHFASVERDVSAVKFHAEQLNTRNSELRDIRENLEKLVSQRTRDLRNVNVKLEKLAYFDPLTDIPNRRAFEEALDKSTHFAHRHGYSLLIGIADVDHFKKLNDTFGHAFGDDVLVAVAKSMKQFFRQEDGIGRVGGEEFAFCMVLPGSHEAIDILERLRKRVELISSSLPALKGYDVTISIGAYYVSEVNPSETKEMVSIADEALYRAKREGRNRVSLVRQDKTEFNSVS